MNTVNPQKVLEEIAEYGLTRVSVRELYALIDHVNGFGASHLSRDPDFLRIWGFFSSRQFNMISQDNAKLFAMIVIDETAIY